MARPNQNAGNRILGASSQRDDDTGQYISLEEFIRKQAAKVEVGRNLPPTAKAKEYSNALADFRRDDSDDVFVPYVSDAFAHGPNISIVQKLNAQAKTVGSKVVPSNFFPHVTSNASRDAFGNNYFFGDGFSLGDHCDNNGNCAPASNPMNYASVAKRVPQRFQQQKLHENAPARQYANNNSPYFPKINVGQANRSGLPTGQVVPASTAIPARGRTLNGATIVNGINLANLKFVKPAPQCFKWDDHRHRQEQPNCRLWHPRELCKYYPKCTLSAEVCGFGHPFCGEYCECVPEGRSLQKNHRIVPLHLQEARKYMKQNSDSEWKTQR